MMRHTVIDTFPRSTGLPKDVAVYLKQVDEIYVNDAYNSLSIEGYRVTPELIEKVRIGNWSPDNNEPDKEHRNAMSARGYWQAFQAVKNSIKDALNGKNPGLVAYNDHSRWYRELFAPGVTAGILKASDLAGYRKDQVYIKGSKHIPLNHDALRDSMPVFFELLKEEIEPCVRAVLGHFIFVYIHPYMDGNGRIGRFLMNSMLASGGYSWTVIPIEKRNEYMSALEKASVDQDILPFSRFIAKLVQSSGKSIRSK
jgi:Fic family protein